LSIEQRNAFYKGILAAKKGKALSDVPITLGSSSIGMWLSGFNDEKERMKLSRQQQDIKNNPH